MILGTPRTAACETLRDLGHRRCSREQIPSKLGLRKDASRLSVPEDDIHINNMLRRELLWRVRSRLPMTYRSLAVHVAISSPDLLRNTLETLMKEDADEGRPLLSAVVVSDSVTGLPAPWFFRKASELGLFFGSPDDVEAFAFHASEFYRATRFYAQTMVGNERKARGWCLALTGELGLWRMPCFRQRI